MGSILGFGQGDDEFERADTPSPEAPVDGRQDSIGESPDEKTTAEALFEDQAVEASAWLAGRRAAKASGGSEHAVGASKIVDPVGNDQVRLGRSLAVMPHTDAAFSAGTIAEKHVRKLAVLANCARTAEAFAEDEEQLVVFAKDLSWRDFEDRLKLWQLFVDPDGVVGTPR